MWNRRPHLEFPEALPNPEIYMDMENKSINA